MSCVGTEYWGKLKGIRILIEILFHQDFDSFFYTYAAVFSLVSVLFKSVDFARYSFILGISSLLYCVITSFRLFNGQWLMISRRA